MREMSKKSQYNLLWLYVCFYYSSSFTLFITPVKIFDAKKHCDLKKYELLSF